ncbi:MAG: G/U mismatch-specific DNA glycosylase [Myxococcota bacterium]
MGGRGPTAASLKAAYGKTIPDILGPDLRVLFVGINPSLYSAVVGHHFARPGNRFWPALHLSGLTPSRLKPDQDSTLLDYGIGLTNIVDRATARGDELSKDDLIRGGRALIRKIRKWRPRCVAIVGVTAYRAAFGRPKASMGFQEEQLADAPLWVLPNPSGLNAHYQIPDLAEAYGAVDQWLASNAER